MEALTLRDWLTIVAVLIGAGSLWFAFRRDLRETKSNVVGRPQIKAVINRKYYLDSWRSVNLHVVPSDTQPNFPYDQWRIYHARLISPGGAVLARAEKDDYATGVFYPENPVREIAGRAQGKPQRFALEFFILFEGEERGQQAKLRVTYGPADETWRATKTLTATVPMDVHAAPPESKPQ